MTATLARPEAVQIVLQVAPSTNSKKGATSAGISGACIIANDGKRTITLNEWWHALTAHVAAGNIERYESTDGEYGSARLLYRRTEKGEQEVLTMPKAKTNTKSDGYRGPRKGTVLPPVGTVLKGRFRGKEHVCKIVADGVHYGEHVYPSLTAAAVVIVRPNKISGPVFWGLRKRHGKDPDRVKGKAAKAPIAKKRKQDRTDKKARATAITSKSGKKRGPRKVKARGKRK